MLLRYFSLQTQARPLKTESKPDQVRRRLGRLPRIAFLITCGELRTPFLRTTYKRLESTDKNLAEEFCRELSNLHFALEVARTFEWLKAENLADLGDEDCASIATAIFGGGGGGGRGGGGGGERGGGGGREERGRGKATPDTSSSTRRRQRDSP